MVWPGRASTVVRARESRTARSHKGRRYTTTPLDRCRRFLGTKRVDTRGIRSIPRVSHQFLILFYVHGWLSPYPAVIFRDRGRPVTRDSHAVSDPAVAAPSRKAALRRSEQQPETARRPGHRSPLPRPATRPGGRRSSCNSPRRRSARRTGACRGRFEWRPFHALPIPAHANRSRQPRRPHRPGRSRNNSIVFTLIRDKAMGLVTDLACDYRRFWITRCGASAQTSSPRRTVTAAPRSFTRPPSSPTPTMPPRGEAWYPVISVLLRRSPQNGASAQ